MSKLFVNERRKKLIENYYANKLEDVELLIDNVIDPHNVAAVSRTADALGIRRINLYYTYNKLPDLKNIGGKSSSSANKWIEYNSIFDLDCFVGVKRKEGWKFIGADAHSGAKRLDKFKFNGKMVLVFGQEKKGISEELKKKIDIFVKIPMVGMVESYNISVAAALFMYEIYKQKGKKLKMREDYGK